MKFNFGRFSCDVEVFENGKDTVLRFFDKSKEQNEAEITNLVIVDSGYGFLCLRVKGRYGLLSGFLDKAVFSSVEMAEAAVDFAEKLFPEIEPVYHHVDCVKQVDYLEYNGEY
ncbi:MAG: hypothetical protein FWG66_10990 [Spirochaetes bacterium]|nr:hypothetical protein [Spirochaetota bacterium]